MYFDALHKISNLDISRIYSMHDDFELSASLIASIEMNIRTNLAITDKVWDSPVDGRSFRRILLGDNQLSMDYFDFVMPDDMYLEGICNV